MAKIADRWVADFTGGMRDDKSDYQKKNNELVTVVNFDVDELGRMKKRRGSHQLGDTVTLGSTGDDTFGTWVDNSFYWELNDPGSGTNYFHLLNDNTGNSNCKLYQLIGRRVNGAIATTDTEINLYTKDNGDEPDFSASGIVEIDGDLITYTGGGTTDQLTGVSGITSNHVDNSAAHQWVLIDDSSTPDGRLGIYYASLANQLYINGYLGGAIFDGSSVTDVSDSDEALGIFATTYDQRIYVAGSGGSAAVGPNGLPTRVSFCEPGDPTDWGDNTINFFDVEDTLGEYITGLHVSAANELLIFKTNSFFAFNKTSLRQRSHSVGAYNHRVVKQIDNLIYTFCPEGVFVTNGLTTKRISEPVKNWVKDFKPQRDATFNRIVINTFAAAFDKKYILYIGDTSSAESLSDVALVYDTERDSWTVYQGFTDFRHLVGLRSFKYGGGINKSQSLFGGDESGKYYRFFSKTYVDGDNEQNEQFVTNGDLTQDLLSDTGVPVFAFCETKFYEMNNPRQFKQFRYLRVLAENKGVGVSFKVQDLLGESDWISLGETVSTNHIFELPQRARGYRIKFKFTHADSNSIPTINGFILEKTDGLVDTRVT